MWQIVIYVHGKEYLSFTVIGGLENAWEQMFSWYNPDLDTVIISRI